MNVESTTLDAHIRTNQAALQAPTSHNTVDRLDLASPNIKSNIYLGFLALVKSQVS